MTNGTYFPDVAMNERERNAIAMLADGKVVSKRHLFSLWDETPTDLALQMVIHSLRRKLRDAGKKHRILTHRGVGYSITPALIKL